MREESCGPEGLDLHNCELGIGTGRLGGQFIPPRCAALRLGIMLELVLAKTRT